LVGRENQLSSPRYLPLPEPVITPGENPAPGMNHSVVTTTTGIHGTMTGPLQQGVSMPLLILLAAASLLIIALLILSIASTRMPQGSTMFKISVSKEDDLRIQYSYTGVKEILWRTLRKLRSIHGCGTCTPRELARLRISMVLKRFSEVYEDVVYGDQHRDDALEVVRLIEEGGGSSG